VHFAGAAYTRQRVRENKEEARRHPGAALYARIWHDAAREAGATIEERGHGTYELRRGAARTTVRMNVTELDDEATLQVALDRSESTRRLQQVGVTIPEQVEFALAEREPAERLLERGAIVVKPATGTSGGDGITADVRTRDELIHAAVRAARAGPVLVAERFVQAAEHRLLFLDGELLDVVRRRAPSVTGDGRSTLGELVAQENRRRLDAAGEDGLKLVTIDLDAVLTLRRADLTLRSVPTAGERVTLKHLASQAGRRDSERVDPATLDPALLNLCRIAGKAIGLRLFGVDAVGNAVIEVNGTPGLHYHEHVSSPPRTPPVAATILERLLA
jgi:glutathione synthase/RimK-type ligase-like ATP-grasp enzyme